MPYSPQHASTLRLRIHTLVVASVAVLALIVGAFAGFTGMFTDGADAASRAYTIWPSTTTPRVAADSDTSSVEVGVKFSSTTNGTITSIRFFKSSSNTGKHTGTLWNENGTVASSVTFTNETASGWQEATLAKPVSIVAGKTYVASYRAPSGRYSADVGKLSPTVPTTNRDLTATRGVYTYGAGMPTQTYQDSNYYVDVRFAPSATRSVRPVPRITRATTSTTTAPSPSTTTGATQIPATSTSSSSTSATPTNTMPATTGTSATTPSSTTSTTTSTSSMTGCAAKPSVCGYPDASNTGVVAGTSLRAVPAQATSGPGWHWDTRGWVTIDGDGAVFEGYSLTAGIDVVAKDVTIRNVRMVQGGEGFGIALRHTAGVTIEKSEITAPDASSRRLMVGIKDIYGDSTGLRILGNDISRTSTGVQIESGLIQDNYIHDLGLTGGDHVNGTTSNGGTRALTLRHNTVLNPHSQTDAISLFQDFGAQANRVIDNNLLAGGGYTIYAGANGGKESTATNITVTNNRIARTYYPQGGSYGPIAAYISGNGNTFQGNVWDDTGAALEL